MTADVGKREAHKIATRHAIQTAADRLFGSRGYTETTVRDIADAAGVTERTFFRYFSGKEALLVKDIDAWLPTLADEVRDRPASESPLEAVRNTMLAHGIRLRDNNNLAWLFQDGPPGPKLEKSAPGLLLRFEQHIADALAHRLSESPDRQFRAEVLARSAVAALRSAGIRHWHQQGGPDQAELIEQAFAILQQG